MANSEKENREFKLLVGILIWFVAVLFYIKGFFPGPVSSIIILIFNEFTIVPFLKLHIFIVPFKAIFIFFYGLFQSIKRILSNLLRILLIGIIASLLCFYTDNVIFLNILRYLNYFCIITLVVFTTICFINPFSFFHDKLQDLKKYLEKSELLFKSAQKLIGVKSFVELISFIRTILFEKNSIQLIFFLFIFLLNAVAAVILLGGLYRIEHVLSGGIIENNNFPGTLFNYMYIATREIVGADLYGIEFKGLKADFLLFLGSILNIYIFAILILGYNTLTSTNFRKEVDNLKKTFNSLKEEKDVNNKEQGPLEITQKD